MQLPSQSTTELLYPGFFGLFLFVLIVFESYRLNANVDFNNAQSRHHFDRLLDFLLNFCTNELDFAAVFHIDYNVNSSFFLADFDANTLCVALLTPEDSRKAVCKASAEAGYTFNIRCGKV